MFRLQNHAHGSRWFCSLCVQGIELGASKKALQLCYEYNQGLYTRIWGLAKPGARPRAQPNRGGETGREQKWLGQSWVWGAQSRAGERRLAPAGQGASGGHTSPSQPSATEQQPEVIQAFILATGTFLGLLLGFTSTAGQAPARGQRPCREGASTEHRPCGTGPQPAPRHRALLGSSRASRGRRHSLGPSPPSRPQRRGRIRPLIRAIAKLTAPKRVSLKGPPQEISPLAGGFKCPSVNPRVLGSPAQHVGTSSAPGKPFLFKESRF